MLIYSNIGYVIDSIDFQKNKLLYSKHFQKQWIGYKTGYNLDVSMQKGLDSLLAKYYDSDDSRNTLLYFWGEWCSPCLNTMPKLLSILKSQSNTKVIFFSFSFKERLLPRVASTMIKYDIRHPNIALHRDASIYYFIRDLHIESYPTYILIDKDNEILFRSNEITELLSLLK